VKPAFAVEDTLHAPRPDTIRWAWGLDVLMAIAILAVLNALAASVMGPAQFKAKATEQLLAGATWRSTLIEHYALTGVWQLSEGSLPRDFAAAAPDAIKWQSRYAASGIVDGVIVTLGRYPGHLEGTAIVTVRPVVARAQEQPTVRWLCGHAATTPGWEGPTVSPAANIPDDFLYSPCRRRPTR
jgi:type II secretory pathway pseudopilin PulG